MSDTTPLVFDEVSSGDRRRTLVALRDRLAYELDKTRSARDVASLTNRLQEVVEAIEALPADKEVSAADEVARRREARRSAASSH